ncbi:MAG TPA: HD domain-containing phosphohydrolase [Spirochaetales bacterium]|nr:HD domain-containing phosphohydrolase [Spirochaetales bacterium]HRY54238.1 HD domain-containing phosphohydrolase [Spirochaetia bacterium]HRZ64869.1 HD domain-containing phosphohydrolase [Spirochaetia bacterium]
MAEPSEEIERLLRSDPERALLLAEAACEEARREPGQEGLAPASALAAYACLSLGDPDRALGFAAQGLAHRGLPPSLRVRLLCAQGISHFQVGRYAEAIARLERAHRLARRAADPASLARALGNLGIAYQEAGRAERSAAYLREALALAGGGAIPGIPAASIRLALGSALIASGRIEEALEALSGVEAAAEAEGSGLLRAEARLGLGEALLVAGRRDESLYAVEEALALAKGGGFAMVGIRAALLLIRVGIEEGDLEGAESLAEEWLPRAAAGDLGRYTELLRLRGRIRALRGRFRDAYEDSERAALLERRDGGPSASEASLERERGSLRRKARRLSERVEGWAEAVTHALADLIEARDERTGAHIDRTLEIARVLGGRLVERRSIPRLGPGLVETIARMAPLHDVGKIAVPDAVLRKPGPLDPEELALMRRHVTVGREILLEASRRIRYDPRVTVAADIAGYHHERWDGEGYPDALAGEDIPLGARIVALADVYDAIRSERPYKPALGREAASAYVLENAGRHFDPRVVEAFADREAEIAGLFGGAGA